MTTPSRIRRSIFRSPASGTSRATGLPCSVTVISSPSSYLGAAHARPATDSPTSSARPSPMSSLAPATMPISDPSVERRQAVIDSLEELSLL